MIRQLFSILAASISFSFLYAQSCNCDHVLSDFNSTTINIIQANSFSYQPGDTFCIEADTVAGLRFIGFEGTPDEPLTFINCNGEVVITEDTYSGIQFSNSRYLRITGTGESSVEYGLHVIASGAGQMGVALGYLCTDIELDHVEIENTGFAGIMAKTDPNCNDTMTWRSGGYVFYNLDIHHNYIHNTGGEGMYIGSTSGYKVQSNVTCSGEYVFAHWLENVDIHHNILENTAWDAIQLNLTRNNGKIHDNTLTNWGTDGELYQDFAMSIGGGKYEIYNNFAYNPPGNEGKGMQMISGQSGSKLYNNVFIDTYSHAIFLHNRHEFEDTTEGYYLINNTIVRPDLSGIFYNTAITLSEDSSLIGNKQNQVPSYFVNNLILDPGSDYASGNTWKDEQECYFDFNSMSTRDAQLQRIYSNIMSRQADSLGLADTLNNNYRAGNSTSALVDTGSDVSTFGITIDYDNIQRPQLNGWDIGAYEFGSALADMNELKSDFPSVFPNPFTDQLSIRLPQDSYADALEVHTLSGQAIFKKTIISQSETVHLSFLENGMYLLTLYKEGQPVSLSKIYRF